MPVRIAVRTGVGLIMDPPGRAALHGAGALARWIPRWRRPSLPHVAGAPGTTPGTRVGTVVPGTRARSLSRAPGPRRLQSPTML